MKCVAISDTHGMYRDIDVPDGDVFIHAGDILGRGNIMELVGFNDWLADLPHKYKIVIAGNHDWCFYRSKEQSEALISNAIYLQDEAVEIEGVKFYGSSWQPWFLDWAFNLERGAQLEEKWSLIPENTDVLITHGPPMYILDKVSEGEHVGCANLSEHVKRVQPKFHVFGHIHEGYGVHHGETTTFINASVNTERYVPSNPAIQFEIN